MSIDIVKSIRKKTSLPLKDIQKAVNHLGTNDEEKIISYLREQGLLKQQARNDRDTNHGGIFCYVHEGRLGVMIELRCETDFVARSEDFKTLGNNICLHIAAFQPKFINSDSVDPDFINSELNFARSQLESEGKPADKIDMILEGKKKKIIEENSLYSQSYLMNTEISVSDIISETIQKTGEKIHLSKFTIYSINS